MSHQVLPREASPRVIGGPSALSSPARGRPSAPRVSPWLPILAKVAAAVVAAGVLAVVGVSAGPPPSTSIASAAIVALPQVPSPLSPPVAATGDVPPLAEARGDPGPGVTADGRVILNVASEDELMKLPGIGPSRARAIVALRQRLAKFRAVEDLLRVKGIGRKTLRRIKPNVVLDRPPVADAGLASSTG
jgi:competence protein ComEA